MEGMSIRGIDVSYKGFHVIYLSAEEEKEVGR